MIIPPDEFSPDTSLRSIRAAAAERAPLRGVVRVVVVLVEFSDKAMTATAAHFKDLFFSTGVLPHGQRQASTTRRSTGGLIDIEARSSGRCGCRRRSPGTPTATSASARRSGRNPTRGPHPGARRGDRGRPDGRLRALRQRRQRLRRRVHRGPRRRGGEETGNSGDIWSHKWTLPASTRADDGTQHLRLPDGPRGRPDRRLRPRARPPAVRLPGPLRHRLHLGRHRQLVPDGGRLVERQRRHARRTRRRGARRSRAGSR